MVDTAMATSDADSEGLRLRMATRIANEMRDERLETYSQALIHLVSRLIALLTFQRLQLGAFGVSLTMFLLLWLATAAMALASQDLASSEALPTVALHAWAAAVAVLQLRSSSFFAELLKETLSGSIVTSLRDPRDMRDALSWLRLTFNRRRQLYFCLAISALATPASMFGLVLADHSDWVNGGSVLLALLGWFLGATGWYFLIPGVALSSRLRRYELSLFEADPANSQVVRSICSMMHSALFVSAAIATLFTTGIFLIAPGNLQLQISFSVVCAWGPLLFTMTYYQYSLAVVIRRTKARVLMPLERTLAAAQKDVLTKDSTQVERLGKLMDMHRRILVTSNTALDWRGSFATVNTLLLPLASFAVVQLAKLG